jgi:hypothetical protein
VPYTEVLNLTFKCLRKDMRALRLHARYQIFYGSNAKVSVLRSPTRTTTCANYGGCSGNG